MAHQVSKDHRAHVRNPHCTLVEKNYYLVVKNRSLVAKHSAHLPGQHAVSHILQVEQVRHGAARARMAGAEVLKMSLPLTHGARYVRIEHFVRASFKYVALVATMVGVDTVRPVVWWWRPCLRNIKEIQRIDGVRM